MNNRKRTLNVLYDINSIELTKNKKKKKKRTKEITFDIKSNKKLKTSYFDDDSNNNSTDDKIIFLVSNKETKFIDNKSEKPVDLTIQPNDTNNTNDPDDPNKPNKPNGSPPLNPQDQLFIDLLNIIISDINNETKNDDTITPGENDMNINTEEKTKTETILEIKCHNPNCDHKEESEEGAQTLEEINMEKIKSIDDLITLGNMFHCKRRRTFKGMNLRLMHNLVGPLLELKEMVGMDNIKRGICTHILYFLQGFNSKKNEKGDIISCGNCVDCVHNMPCVQVVDDMMHTVITGPPGVGKTCVARIIGKIYAAMGILSNGDFHEVGLNDFIGKYVGQTGPKTKALIDKCIGGVMFIDEAYIMGQKERPDSFCRQAMTILNKALSDNNDLLCIIAGYKKDLKNNFFSMNDGLERRFTSKYDISGYNHLELLDIFKQKISNRGWSINLNIQETEENKDKYDDKTLKRLFKKHKSSFLYFGGDVESLIVKCEIAHAARMPQHKRQLSMNDINEGFKDFIKERKNKMNTKGSNDMYRPQLYHFK